HRDPDDVRPADVERVEQPRGVVGHLVDRVRTGRLRAPADAAVVEDDGAVVLLEVGDLEHPRRRVGGETHDEEERRTAAVLLVVEVQRVEPGDAHGRAVCPNGSPRASSSRKSGWARAISARARSTSLSTERSTAPCSVTTHCTWWRGVVTVVLSPRRGTMVEIRRPPTVAVDLEPRLPVPPRAPA